jgi:hypothetical protein
MFMASLSCHEVVPGRYGEQVKYFRADSLKEINSFMDREGGQRRTRLSKFNDMAIVF